MNNKYFFPVLGRAATEDKFKVYSGGINPISNFRGERIWFHGASVVNGKFCDNAQRFSHAWTTDTNILTSVKGNCSFII